MAARPVGLESGEEHGRPRRPAPVAGSPPGPSYQSRRLTRRQKPTYETIAAQLLAASFVIGSYYLAEYLKVTRPLKRGAQPAVRSTAPPDAVRS